MTTSTTELTEAEQLEVTVERLIDNEVLACQSALVSELLNNEHKGFGFDGIENLYDESDEAVCESCGEERESHVGAFLACPTSPSREFEAPTQETLEWWLVTSWLCRKLRAIGEPVLDNGYGTWWGRTCSGQAIKLDGTFQEIARSLNAPT